MHAEIEKATQQNTFCLNMCAFMQLQIVLMCLSACAWEVHELSHSGHLTVEDQELNNAALL